MSLNKYSFHKKNSANILEQKMEPPAVYDSKLENFFTE